MSELISDCPSYSVNDYGAEGIGSKSNALYSVVSGFVKDGVPIDAVGFQCHFGLGQVPDTLQQNLQRFADLGLDVAITELDINIGGPANATTLALQAQDYWKVVTACKNVNRCVSVVCVFLLSSLDIVLKPSLDCLGCLRRPLLDPEWRCPALGRTKAAQARFLCDCGRLRGQTRAFCINSNNCLYFVIIGGTGNMSNASNSSSLVRTSSDDHHVQWAPTARGAPPHDYVDFYNK